MQSPIIQTLARLPGIIIAKVQKKPTHSSSVDSASKPQTNFDDKSQNQMSNQDRDNDKEDYEDSQEKLQQQHRKRRNCIDMLSVWTEFNCDKSINDRIANGASRSRRRRVISDADEDENDDRERKAVSSRKTPDHVASLDKGAGVRGTRRVDQVSAVPKSTGRVLASTHNQPSTSKQTHANHPQTCETSCSATKRSKASISASAAVSPSSKFHPAISHISSDDEKLAESVARHRAKKRVKSKSKIHINEAPSSPALSQFFEISDQSDNCHTSYSHGVSPSHGLDSNSTESDSNSIRQQLKPSNQDSDHIFDIATHYSPSSSDAHHRVRRYSQVSQSDVIERRDASSNLDEEHPRIKKRHTKITLQALREQQGTGQALNLQSDLEDDRPLSELRRPFAGDCGSPLSASPTGSRGRSRGRPRLNFASGQQRQSKAKGRPTLKRRRFTESHLARDIDKFPSYSYKRGFKSSLAKGYSSARLSHSSKISKGRRRGRPRGRPRIIPHCQTTVFNPHSRLSLDCMPADKDEQNFDAVATFSDSELFNETSLISHHQRNLNDQTSETNLLPAISDATIFQPRRRTTSSCQSENEDPVSHFRYSESRLTPTHSLLVFSENDQESEKMDSMRFPIERSPTRVHGFQKQTSSKSSSHPGKPLRGILVNDNERKQKTPTICQKSQNISMDSTTSQPTIAKSSRFQQNRSLANATPKDRIIHSYVKGPRGVTEVEVNQAEDDLFLPRPHLSSMKDLSSQSINESRISFEDSDLQTRVVLMRQTERETDRTSKIHKLSLTKEDTTKSSSKSRSHATTLTSPTTLASTSDAEFIQPQNPSNKNTHRRTNSQRSQAANSISSSASLHREQTSTSDQLRHRDQRVSDWLRSGPDAFSDPPIALPASSHTIPSPSASRHHLEHGSTSHHRPHRKHYHMSLSAEEILLADGLIHKFGHFNIIDRVPQNSIAPFNVGNVKPGTVFNPPGLTDLGLLTQKSLRTFNSVHKQVCGLVYSQSNEIPNTFLSNFQMSFTSNDIIKQTTMNPFNVQASSSKINTNNSTTKSTLINPPRLLLNSGPTSTASGTTGLISGPTIVTPEKVGTTSCSRGDVPGSFNTTTADTTTTITTTVFTSVITSTVTAATSTTDSTTTATTTTTTAAASLGGLRGGGRGESLGSTPGSSPSRVSGLDGHGFHPRFLDSGESLVAGIHSRYPPKSPPHPPPPSSQTPPPPSKAAVPQTPQRGITEEEMEEAEEKDVVKEEEEVEEEGEEAVDEELVPIEEDDSDTTDDDTGIGNSDDAHDDFNLGTTAQTTAQMNLVFDKRVDNPGLPRQTDQPRNNMKSLLIEDSKNTKASLLCTDKHLRDPISNDLPRGEFECDILRDTLANRCSNDSQDGVTNAKDCSSDVYDRDSAIRRPPSAMKKRRRIQDMGYGQPRRRKKKKNVVCKSACDADNDANGANTIANGANKSEPRASKGESKEHPDCRNITPGSESEKKEPASQAKTSRLRMCKRSHKRMPANEKIAVRNSSSDEEGKEVKLNSGESRPIPEFHGNFYRSPEDDDAKEIYTTSSCDDSDTTIHSCRQMRIPLPVGEGRKFMEQQQDYKMPFDVRSKLQSNEEKSSSSKNYKKIKLSVYHGQTRSMVTAPQPPTSCNCSVSPNEKQGCTDGHCYNRMMYAECKTNSCPCGLKCANNRMQKAGGQLAIKGVKCFDTPNKGQGVKTSLPIDEDVFIIEYIGEVVSDAEFMDRMSSRYRQDGDHYAMSLTGNTIIDGYRMGNMCRTVNHSCQPNCEMQKWSINGFYRMGLFTKRKIKAGEELTYDYNFHSFNLESQQKCMCGATNCRGVVGGKETSDHISPKSTKSFSLIEDFSSVDSIPYKELKIGRENNLFLIRNMKMIANKIRRMSNQSDKVKKPSAGGSCTLTERNQFFHTRMNALSTSRSIKTRTLALAYSNSELERTAEIIQILSDLFQQIVNYKDDNGDQLAALFLNVPSKKVLPSYHIFIKKIVDLTLIQMKIKTGQYSNIELFNEDVLLMISNHQKFCGRNSSVFEIARKLLNKYRKSFHHAKALLAAILNEQFNDSEPDDIQLHVPEKTNEDILATPDTKDSIGDVIRCVCSIYKDEGLMLQCETCQKWQHCQCMDISNPKNVKNYQCELCNPRLLSQEILQTDKMCHENPAYTYYTTLLREDGMQFVCGDCIYVKRTNNGKLHSDGTPFRVPFNALDSELDTMTKKELEDLDIILIERLWKNSRNEGFLRGFHYYRPQDTKHKADQLFYEKELIRSPMQETTSISNALGKCCIMHPRLYVKGHPRGISDPKHLYVCEYRVNSTQSCQFIRLGFGSGSPFVRYEINTKSYCFDKYRQRLTLMRTFTADQCSDHHKPALSILSSGLDHSKSGHVQQDSDEAEEEDDPLINVVRKKNSKKTKSLEKIILALSLKIT